MWLYRIFSWRLTNGNAMTFTSWLLKWFLCHENLNIGVIILLSSSYWLEWNRILKKLKTTWLFLSFNNLSFLLEQHISSIRLFVFGSKQSCINYKGPWSDLLIFGKLDDDTIWYVQSHSDLWWIYVVLGYL